MSLTVGPAELRPVLSFQIHTCDRTRRQRKQKQQEKLEMLTHLNEETLSSSGHQTSTSSSWCCKMQCRQCSSIRTICARRRHYACCSRFRHHQRRQDHAEMAQRNFCRDVQVQPSWS